MRYDENYFQNGKNQDEPKTIKRAFGRRTGPLERQTAKESVCAQQCVEDASRRAFVDCVRHVFYRYAYKNRRYDPSAGNRIFVRIFRVPPHARVDMDL